MQVAEDDCWLYFTRCKVEHETRQLGLAPLSPGASCIPPRLEECRQDPLPRGPHSAPPHRHPRIPPFRHLTLTSHPYRVVAGWRCNWDCRAHMCPHFWCRVDSTQATASRLCPYAVLCASRGDEGGACPRCSCLCWGLALGWGNGMDGFL